MSISIFGAKTARASEKPYTFDAPSSTKALAHAFKVAPEVAISSTTNIFFPLTSFLFAWNASVIFACRSVAVRPTCDRVSRILINAREEKGAFKQRAIGRASKVA